MNFYSVTFQKLTIENILIVAPDYKTVLNWCKSEQSCNGWVRFTIEEHKQSVYKNTNGIIEVRLVENCTEY